MSVYGRFSEDKSRQRSVTERFKAVPLTEWKLNDEVTLNTFI